MPASIRSTRRPGSADSWLASTHPADPPPMMTSSNTSSFSDNSDCGMGSLSTRGIIGSNDQDLLNGASHKRRPPIGAGHDHLGEIDALFARNPDALELHLGCVERDRRIEAHLGAEAVIG